MTSIYNYFFGTTTEEEPFCKVQGTLFNDGQIYDHCFLEIQKVECYAYTINFIIDEGYIELPIEKNINLVCNDTTKTFYFYNKQSFTPTNQIYYENLKSNLLKIIYKDETFVQPKFSSSIVLEYNKNNLFVVEDRELEIFKLDKDLSLSQTLNPFDFDVSKILLKDKTLFALDQNNKKTISSLNLERSDILENYNIEGIVINDIVNTQKNYETPQYEFLGINKNGIMTLDTRSKTPLIRDKSLFYNADSKSGINCITTSGNGDIYIGTDKGVIKIYKRKNIEKDKRTDVEKSPRAKMIIPLFQEVSVNYLDVSFDGTKIIATTDEACFFIKLSIFERDYEIFVFDISEADRKRYCVINTPYLSAKFDNTFNKLAEEKIVVSRGNIIIEWEIKNINTPSLGKYTITKLSSNIIDMGYTLCDNDIVYATEEKFGVLN